MEACPHVTTRKRTRDTAAAAAAAASNTSGSSNTAARRGRAPSEVQTNAETDVVDVDVSGGDGAERTRRGGSTRCIDEHDTSASHSSNDSSNDNSNDSSSGSGSKEDEGGGGGGSRDGKTRARSRVHAASVTKATSARLSSGGNSNNNNNNSHGTATAAVVAPRASEERRRSSGAHSHPRASHVAAAAAPAPPSSSASSTCAPHSHRTRASDAGERIDVSPSKPRCGSGNSSGGNSSVVVAATGTATATSVSRHAVVTSCVAVDATMATTTTASANNSTATSSSSSSSSGGGDGGAAAAAGNVAGDMHSNSSAAAAGGEARRYKQPTLAAYGLVSDTAALRKELADKEQQLDEATRRAGALEEAARRHADELALAQQQLGALHARLQRFRAVMREEMLRTAKQSRAEARRVLHARHFELGHIAVLPHNGREVWVEGDAVRSVLVQLRDVQARRDEVEQLKKNAQALVKQLSRQDKERDDAAAAVSSSASSSASSTAAAAAATNNNSNNATMTTTADAYEALLEAQEELQLRTAEHAALTAALVALRERHTALEHEKKAFLKEIRRVNDEDASEFVARATMGDDGRYVLMHLLGKGGFSEVWCAFDLAEARYVACKVHRVSPEWPAATREHYLHHAERELAIMRAVRHPHVVQLYDVFRLHESAFVSVMEYSHGMDLDTYLKRYHTLKEADARLVLLQVVNALRYLASLERPVIHYDLKPANVLFHSPDAHVLAIKITDFGLSKLLPRNDSNNGNNGNGKGDGAGSSGGGVCAGGPSDNPSIELTSQGTGTYWYLPPECFDTSSTTPPRISSKVDIWSVGVLFYQMLYGRRPFAEGESQRKIWQEQLIVRAARTLHFPDTPRVSEEAKALMRGCLAFHVAERYDIATLSQHPYLTRTTRRGTRSARNNSNNSSTMTATHTTTAAGLMPAPAAPAHAHASMATTATATAGVAPLLSTTSAEAAVPALSHTAPPPPPSSSSPADAAVE